MKKTQNINPNQILGKVTKFDETWRSYLKVVKQNLPGELFLSPPPTSPRLVIIKEQRVWKLMITFIKNIAKCYVYILWEILIKLHDIFQSSYWNISKILKILSSCLCIFCFYIFQCIYHVLFYILKNWFTLKNIFFTFRYYF